MNHDNHYEIIIIGGSYAGLSAAMSLGRALRKVLVIDNRKPCNRQTPHSHNFLTQDGQTPAQITAIAREQVEKYSTVHHHDGVAVSGAKTTDIFEITTQSGALFTAKKIIFATGLRDIMPDISGFAACWGISIVHCPYCHGYEIKNERTGILANGDMGFQYAQLISNWTNDLVIFTNGKSTFTEEQTAKIRRNDIQIIEKEIDNIEHDHGKVQHIRFKDQSTFSVNAIYTRPEIVQHCDIPAALGCELTEQGLIKVDAMQKTTVEGVYACGDNSGMRAVSMAVAAGTMAGAALNGGWIEERF